MTKNIVEKTKKNKVIEANIEGKNNSKLLYLGLGLILVGVIGLSLFLFLDKDSNKIDDNKKFKEEYEGLNDKKVQGVKYKELNIEPNNIEYIDSENMFDLLEDGTGVVYFGFPDCPWCRTLVPVLLDASNEVGIDKIYYLNNYSERDQKKLEDGKIVTEKEGTENYNKLVDKLKDYLWSYEDLKDDSIKRIYYPMVLFLREGKVVDVHIDTVESQENPFVDLTDSEYKELFNILINGMYKTISCDDAC